MANIMMTHCTWCGETFIKERLGQLHGCEAEKNPQILQAAPVENEEAVEMFQGAGTRLRRW